jgi:hypothetical protein
MANVEIIQAPKPELAARAGQVLAKILMIRDGLYNSMFELADLLSEAKKNDYHTHWGYVRFDEWVEQGSGLDISARTAFYLINIVEKANELGIPREAMSGVKISKLKSIFSLDSTKHADSIKLLLENAESKSLEEINEEVWKIKSNGNGEPMAYITIKMPKSVKDDVVDLAFDMVRREIGDVVNPETGEISEATPGRCMEFICVEWMQDAHRKLQEAPKQEPIPVEEAI